MWYPYGKDRTAIGAFIGACAQKAYQLGTTFTYKFGKKDNALHYLTGENIMRKMEGL